MKKSYTESLSHTTLKCKYHIVFAPKFRRHDIRSDDDKRIHRPF